MLEATEHGQHILGSPRKQGELQRSLVSKAEAGSLQPHTGAFQILKVGFGSLGYLGKAVQVGAVVTVEATVFTLVQVKSALLDLKQLQRCTQRQLEAVG